MRLQLGVSIVACLLLYGPRVANADETDQKTAEEKAKSVHRWSEETARKIRLTIPDTEQKAELIGGSLLQWSNPIVGEVYGDCFMWASEGRPVAFLSVYAFFEPVSIRRLTFQSLSESPVVAKMESDVIWSPDQPGIQWMKLDEAPVKSSSVAAQQRQLRVIASRYSARIAQANDEALFRDLRLLARPLYTYQSKSARIQQGAVFTFVDGTDPELLLLVEREDKNEPTLRLAPVRQNHRQLLLSRDGEQVWEAPKIAPPFPNPKISDPKGVYFNSRWDALQPSTKIDGGDQG